MHVPDIHAANISQVPSCCTATHTDLQRRATFPFLFQVTCIRLWCMRRTRPVEGSSLQKQVKQVPGHYQYRSQRAVGIADTSIFAPSLQGNLRKLGFYDSFMVCSCLLYPLRFTSSLSESRLLRRRHGSCSKFQALSFAKSRHTSSTSFTVGQAPPRAVFAGIGKSQYRPIGEMTRISRIILGSKYAAGP